jgi:hypothetical protein
MLVTSPVRSSQQVQARSLCRKSNNVTYSSWLSACDRFLRSMTEGQIMGTYCLNVSDFPWAEHFDRDKLPSDAVNACLSPMQGEC